MTGRIAVVGIALRYPDADDVQQFWQNILAERRAFRTLPDERMNKADYWSSDPSAPDRFYATSAAVLRNFEFDRNGFGVSGSTYRSTDLTHWLALTVAREALEDAGLLADGLDHSRTSVVFGNSLTGEFSRANLMRLRWPYVRRVVGAALSGKDWTQEEVADFLGSLEETYKAPFPPITEDTLAGGLANTIAGRICNHFDLGGGGYTVDGACSSSLLSIVTAARSLVEGDVDHVVAGGVDLSIDPFEVIGFAKTGALSRSEMTIYDKNSDGFWPGEGCGVVVLMREEDAIAAGHHVYAVLAGWGVSSDGAGGLTRPEESGHRTAMARAYSRAGYPASSVGYFEGHGTGTAVGDATEIQAISGALAESGARGPVALGSIKGNIGHTKAAAGVAGFIKACLALHHRTVPPVTGNVSPHPALEGSLLRLPVAPEPFEPGVAPRCGVSAMGFGGINTHVTLEAAEGWSADEPAVTGDTLAQDAELLVFSAGDDAPLAEQVRAVRDRVTALSMSELGDLAAELARAASRTDGASTTTRRAAVVARTPLEAQGRLDTLVADIEAGRVSSASGVHHHPGATGRIGFVFPGQGSGTDQPAYLSRRFTAAREITTPHAVGAPTETHVAQPRIVADSLRALAVLDDLGVRATVAAGHSLGELTALHWGGALDGATVLDLARQRGRVMSEHGSAGGAMASVATTVDTAQALADSVPGVVVVSGHNAPEQTIVSGDLAAVDRVVEVARDNGLAASRLAVSHAFHSPHVEQAAVEFEKVLTDVSFAPLARPVVSSRTADTLTDTSDLGHHLGRQIVEPVQWHRTVSQVAQDVDLVVEVGPGTVLGGLAAAAGIDTPVLSTHADSPSAAPLLSVLGGAYAVGAPVDVRALFEGRVVRELPATMTFLASPCEEAPADVLDDASSTIAGVVTGADLLADAPAAVPPAPAAEGEPVLDVLLEAVARRTELPLESLTASTHPLDDLHISSITINQIAAEVTSALGRGGLPAATNLATSTLGDLAAAIEQSAAGAAEQDDLAGVGPWVRAFEIRQEPTPRSPVGTSRGTGYWSSVGRSGLAAELASALEGARLGSGAVVCADADDVVTGGTLLRACREVAALDGGALVVVDHGFGAAGFARSFALEHPESKVVIVTPSESAPPSVEELTAHVVAEVGHGPHVVETRLAEGARTESLLAAWEGGGSRSTPLHEGDVLLVTGGGKGIVAESALTLARRWGVSVGLVGRADPDTDPELAGNLARMRDAGIRWHYARADVTDAAAVRSAVQEVRRELGTITGVAHGAGLNSPARIEDLDAGDVARTYAVKVDGFAHVMEEVQDDPLRLVVTFGSIIGRAGLDGEAHYAAANDRVRVLTEAFAEAHPSVRTRVLEWSVWAGAGMGERLGVLTALKEKGITPIGLDDGLDMLVTLLESDDAPTTTVVAGRMGRMATVRRERRPLPLGRFLETARIDYPGVELVVESTLSRVTDHYLDDHELDGDYLFPAVMGMEAMTQAATALTGHDGPVSLRDVTFMRPVVVPADGTTTLRVCALVNDDGDVEVALRTSATHFVEDHFRAVVHLGRDEPVAQVPRPTSSASVDVAHEQLYRTLFFQGLRFQRVRRYLDLGARHAVVLLSPEDPAPWFAPHLPDGLRLGSPGLRDALMHALQSCVPTAVLLPMGVDRIDAAGDFGTEDVRMEAAEVSQDGDEYVYDVVATTADGVVLERWTGLRLRAVRHRRSQLWSAPMLAGHLERTCERVGLGSLSVALVHGSSRDEARDTVASLAAHRDVVVGHRPDGRPEIPGGHISLSHGEECLSLAAVGDAPVACDVARVESRDSATWFSMLGQGLSSLTVHLQGLTDEPLDVAATRVWTALECLRKVGRHDEGLTLESHDGAVVALRAGSMVVATLVAELADDGGTHAFAVGAEPAGAARLPEAVGVAGVG